MFYINSVSSMLFNIISFGLIILFSILSIISSLNLCKLRYLSRAYVVWCKVNCLHFIIEDISCFLNICVLEIN